MDSLSLAWNFRAFAHLLYNAIFLVEIHVIRVFSLKKIIFVFCMYSLILYKAIVIYIIYQWNTKASTDLVRFIGTFMAFNQLQPLVYGSINHSVFVYYMNAPIKRAASAEAWRLSLCKRMYAYIRGLTTRFKSLLNRS